MRQKVTKQGVKAPCRINRLLLYCNEKKQLIREQRYQIQSLLQVDTPKKKIAALTGTSVSSVYRETIRNKGKRGYTAAAAQELCEIRKERYRGNRKFTPAMERHVRDRLTEKQRSPQQIVGEAALCDIHMVSHERIHQFIRQDKTRGGEPWKHTRHRLKHRKLRDKLQSMGITFDTVCTDAWDSFISVFKQDNHIIGKADTKGIEGNNCRLRHRIRRAFRKTCRFSKILFNHLKAFDLAFFYINFGFV
ncbi:hypothetical protein EZS27_015623 [termite gut metagenome]|uniref:Uncharacterized protein n=1 Tax=termite gut metagenome TaxID=433724 RepID=A0A5J4RQK8_9ZZZZ